MSRRIKISLGIGINNCKQIGYQDLPEGWDGMTESEQDQLLDEIARDFSLNYIDLGAWVEECNEKD